MVEDVLGLNYGMFCLGVGCEKKLFISSNEFGILLNLLMFWLEGLMK